METLDSPVTAIRKIRVRFPAGDRLSAQARVGAQLRNASMHVASLPPAAILCVRSLKDPRPRSLRLDAARMAAPPEWESALCARLEEISRRAVRAAFDPVPDDAPAVWFADRAELLAALARAALDGSLYRMWWCGALLGPGDLRSAVRREWNTDGTIAPAALEILAKSGQAVAMLASWSDAEAQSVLQVVAHAHGIRIPSAVFAPSDPLTTPRSRATPIVALAPEPPSPWSEVVPEVDATPLTPTARMLLGIALTIRRRPFALSTPSFHRRWEDWAVSRAAPQGTAAVRQRVATRTSPRAFETGEGPATGDTESTSSFAKHHEGPAPGPEPSPHEHQPAIRPLAHAEPTEFVQANHASTPSGSVSLSSVTSAVATPHSAVAPEPLSVAAPPDLPAVYTQFGGVFFLLNVALYLKLYGDFTTPLAPGIGLNIWDLVALLSREYMGDQIVDDPVWQLLRELAGRDEQTPPGDGFVPASDWRAPDVWPPPPEESALPAWLDWIAVNIRARVSLALGEPDQSAAMRMLLAHSARILCSSTHVDVTFPLQTHPVAIRVAGLDRDPGWIPAAARNVRFHFE